VRSLTISGGGGGLLVGSRSPQRSLMLVGALNPISWHSRSYASGYADFASSASATAQRGMTAMICMRP
jgi:hypothetical protein